MTEPDTEKFYEFLGAVPHQLTIDLVHQATLIHTTRNLAEILGWRTIPTYNSWLALATWWTLCIFFEQVVRYGLPLAAVLILIRPNWFRQQSPPPFTEEQFQSIITDLSTLRQLTPLLLPSRPSITLSPPVLFRSIASLCVAYVVLSHLVSLRTLLALMGTGIITWHAPWAIYIRTTVWKSAYFRTGCYRLWSRISGQPLPTASFSSSSLPSSSQPANTVRFLFTVYENQRWWMGLDWTAALLPAERPSWCTARLDPISPPSAFSLPEPSTIYLTDDHGQRTKRAAHWRWEEAEWKVIIRKEDTTASSRVEKPLPAVKEDNSVPSKTAAKSREPSLSLNVEPSDASAEEPPDWQEEGDIVTDPDGWIYGDNKWEGKSNKGGIGKFTRYRRWTRVAVVEEEVEVVESGANGIAKAEPEPEKADSTVSDSPLRQRLRTALKST